MNLHDESVTSVTRAQRTAEAGAEADLVPCTTSAHATLIEFRHNLMVLSESSIFSNLSIERSIGDNGPVHRGISARLEVVREVSSDVTFPWLSFRLGDK